ncbi:MAG: hypothetical protein HY674_15080 [Chloroflexi bacterium]|nr:hypothetical protein [Chloroflexota bacterium]
MPRAFKLSFLLLAVAALLGFLGIRSNLFRLGSRGMALTDRELATEVLGQYLAQHYPGKKVLVLSNPFTQRQGQRKEIYEFEEAGLRGLRRGLGQRLAVEAVVFPELRPEVFQNPGSSYIDPKTTTPLSYLMADGALDAVWRQHRGAELIVSLIGLPLNVRQTEAWRNPSGPRFALLLPDLRMVGDQKAVSEALEARKIAAIILKRPHAPAEDVPLGKDSQKEFADRYFLVVPETVELLLKQDPRLF